MVRDIILDIQEKDLSTIDNHPSTLPIFDSVWGNLFDEDDETDVLICNVIIPEEYWSTVAYTNDEFVCRFSSSYKPDTRNFRVRLVGLRNGEYGLFPNIRGNFGIQVQSYALSSNIASPISACMLPYIDIDGQFLIKMVKSSVDEVIDKAYIYSAKETDLEINFSDDQASQLLSLCGPGKSYRYPTTGVGITKYLNSVIQHSDLVNVLQSEFEAENKPIQGADFDNQSGQLDLICRPELEETDTDLTPIDELNKDFFSAFTDDFVRRNTVIDEVSDNDFISSLNTYERFLGIILFLDNFTSMSRIADQLEPGRFDGVGNVVFDDEHYIVSATLEANTVIMFDDELEDLVNDAPIFIVNDNDETRLYTSLVEQINWITQDCHKCFILKKRSKVRYMIRKSQFQKGKGLYIIPQTSSNIKNMLGLVQDNVTGRLIGVVSSSTNISDITLDEVTQYIYATQLSE